MNQAILHFIANHRTGTIALLANDNQVHGATVHFAYNEPSSQFIIQTDGNSRKGTALSDSPTAASLVISDPEHPKGYDVTLQISGTAQITVDENIIAAYFEKFPEKKDKWPDDIFFIVNPTWWRYTDWAKPVAERVLSSE